MNKILWVILSISLLCLVVILSGIYILNAKTPGGAAATASAELPVNDMKDEYKNPVDPFSHTMEDVPLPGLIKTEDNSSNGFHTVQNLAIGETQKKETATTTSVLDPGTKIPSTTKSTTTPTPSTPSAVKKTTPAVTVQQKSYYIQTGAFKQKSNADENNITLTENGLGGRIFYETVKGDKYYTVLIGPYATKAEAQKFLNWIKDIKGMSSSYITYKP